MFFPGFCFSFVGDGVVDELITGVGGGEMTVNLSNSPSILSNVEFTQQPSVAFSVTMNIQLESKLRPSTYTDSPRIR